MGQVLIEPLETEVDNDDGRNGDVACDGCGDGDVLMLVMTDQDDDSGNYCGLGNCGGGDDDDANNEEDDSDSDLVDDD